MAALDFDQAVEEFHQAGNEFHKGNSEPMLMIWTQREEASVANPWGPPVRGRK